MQKILFALALMALFGNISRAADEHYLYPKGETCTTSDASYCYASARIVYQYATDSTGGVAITIAMEFSSPYFQPTGGIFVTERGVKEVIQDLTFHTVEAPAGKLSWLEPAEYFTGRYPVAQLKKSGDYSFTIAFGDGNSEAVMQFPEDHFPTFDLSEHICRLNRDQVAFDFDFWSLELLPESVERIRIDFEEGSVSVHNTPFISQSGGLGYISIPVSRVLYREWLSGKKLTTNWTLNGEEIRKTIHFPRLADIRSTCARG